MRALFPILLTLFIIPIAALASNQSCTNENPLLELRWRDIPLLGWPIVLGEWPLAISSQKPEILTEARVKLQFTRGRKPGTWILEVDFAFPDPKPFGIPFSFERVEFSWESKGKSKTSGIDWSRSCTSPGKPLFPRQSWLVAIELDTTEEIGLLENAVFRLWGSRN